jgi:hypothetical protein
MFLCQVLGTMGDGAMERGVVIGFMIETAHLVDIAIGKQPS